MRYTPVGVRAPDIAGTAAPKFEMYAPMFAYVRMRIAVKRCSASIATAASLTWSRPWLSERNVSERSASHFTGRPTLRAA